MAGRDGAEAMDSSSSAISIGDEALDDSSSSSFQCCICLDLLFKPVVLACGHISCFWCVHRAMHGLRASSCPICRKSYKNFPSICQLLHFLLLKIEPAAYKRREKEVLEVEKSVDCFSPQFVDHLISERVHAEKNTSSTIEEIEQSADYFKVSGNIALEENGLENGICKQVSVTNVLCAGCKELLLRPAVLNCGHVYCESCMFGMVDGPLRCQVCQSLHPGDFPNVCWDLDHFLEQQFPEEYTMRRETEQRKRVSCQHGDLSSRALESRKQNANSSSHAKDNDLWLNEDLSNTHVGVGCDSCGMYPIIGKRYRCKDCKEKIGFDLCEACYDTSSKLPGRFNQQHTSDHMFELDESQMFCKILMLGALPSEDPYQDLSESGPEDPGNADSVSE